MKCQNLFSGKNKKKKFNMSSAENFAHSAKPNYTQYHQDICYIQQYLKILLATVNVLTHCASRRYLLAFTAYAFIRMTYYLNI